MPACVTVTVCPPIVTLPLRLAVVAFAAMVSVTDPLPVPLAGDTVIHAALLVALHPQPVALAVTPIVLVPPPLAAETVAGDTPMVQVMPAWVMVNAWPAIVTVPVRELVVVFAPAVTVTDPPPMPLAADTVSQAALLVVVQPQSPALAVTATPVVPPAAAMEALAGEMAYVHPMPGCVTVTVRPATVAVPVRALDEAFAATVRLVDPLPVPLAGEAVIHAALLVAVHAQPLVAVTAMLAVPPPTA
jgi:hypothetical protein